MLSNMDSFPFQGMSLLVETLTLMESPNMADHSLYTSERLRSRKYTLYASPHLVPPARFLFTKCFYAQSLANDLQPNKSLEKQQWLMMDLLGTLGVPIADNSLIQTYLTNRILQVRIRY